MKKARLDLAEALGLIKSHITAANTKQNHDLHRAIGKIVDAAYAAGILTAKEELTGSQPGTTYYESLEPRRRDRGAAPDGRASPEARGAAEGGAEMRQPRPGRIGGAQSSQYERRGAMHHFWDRADPPLVGCWKWQCFCGCTEIRFYRRRYWCAACGRGKRRPLLPPVHGCGNPGCCQICPLCEGD